MIEADTTNDPTNIALEKVASNFFMHTVRNSSPVKDVAAARAASSGKNQGYGMPSDAPPGPTALII